MKKTITYSLFFLFLTLNFLFTLPNANLSYPHHNSVIKLEPIELTYTITNATGLTLNCNYTVDGLLKENMSFNPASNIYFLKLNFTPQMYKNYTLVLKCDYGFGSFTQTSNILVENHTTDEILFLVVFHVCLLILGVFGFFIFGKKDFLYLLAWLLFFLSLASAFSLLIIVKEILQYLNYQISYKVLLESFYNTLNYLYIFLILLFLVHLGYLFYLLLKLFSVKKNFDNAKGI